MRAVAVMSAGRALYGAALLAAPARLLSATMASRPSAIECRAVRVLGARQLVQAAMSQAGGRRAWQLGTAADGLHSVSMVMLAAARTPVRRAALADAVLAGLLAGAGLKWCPSAGR